MKNTKTAFAATATILAILAASCSSGNDSEPTHRPTTTITATAATTDTDTTPGTSATTTTAEADETAEPASLTLPFETSESTGNITISGDSPIVEWFASQPGEITLDLFDADAESDVSVVEAIVSFWFFRDDNSGDTPPLIYEADDGRISDSLGTVYVVESQGLPPAPGTETTTTTSTTTTTTSTSPEASETPTTSSTTTTTTTTSSIPTVTLPELEPPSSLQVQVLNGSGVAGAAGRMTAKLSQAGYVVRQPANAPGRYRSSAVYYAEDWEDEAAEILAAAEIDEIEQTSPMPEQFSSEQATVIVLLGTDTAPAVAAEQASLRPRQRNDVTLPLSDDIPRDRYVPGLSAVNLYTEQSENDPASAGQLVDLALFMGRVGYCHPFFGGWPQGCQQDISLEDAYQAIEDVLGQLGFTPQNVCGAPAGYSFTDLLQPTREWNETFGNYSGDAIFTTDRLLELHGGERITPEENLDFYIGEAVQTAHDSLRLSELISENEPPQMILCAAWKRPSGELPEYASSVWYGLLTPGLQPQESLMSQGTYHVKEISRNGNLVQVYVCHPTLGARSVLLRWREAGYRAEVTGPVGREGCQSFFEEVDYVSDHEDEPSFKFGFGDQVFSASDLMPFPRAGS